MTTARRPGSCPGGAVSLRGHHLNGPIVAEGSSERWWLVDSHDRVSRHRAARFRGSPVSGPAYAIADRSRRHLHGGHHLVDMHGGVIASSGCRPFPPAARRESIAAERWSLA